MSNTADVLSEAGTAYTSGAPEFIPDLLGGVLVANLFSVLHCPITCRYVQISVMWCLLRYAHENDIRFVLTSS